MSCNIELIIGFLTLRFYKVDMSIPFTFPNNKANFQVVEGVESIKRELEKEADAFTLWRNRFRVEKRNNGIYIYAKCKDCSACMRYKWREEEENYHLVHFNNAHRHHAAQNVNEELQKFIEELPLSIELATARKIATSKFKITSSKFYHAYQRLKKTTTTLTQLITQLQRRDYDVSLDPFPIPPGEIPRIIVIISPQMKEIFKKYGQTVCYDLTYNLIQDISPQKRQYAVGVFTGINSYNKIVPFGLTITCDETTEAFCKIFETFIEANGPPRSFITDEQSSMASAINKITQNGSFEGTHLIDSFHVIRNFSKMSERKDLSAEVSQIIKEQSADIFQMKVKELQKKLKTEGQLRAFQLFFAKRRQVCFSQLPRGSFVIFNASNSINEKMNDLIKCRIRSQKPYAKVLRTLVQFAQSLIQSSQESIELYDFRIQEIFHDPELRLCRYLLARRPMHEFVRHYVASLSLKQPTRRGTSYIFDEEKESYECLYDDGFNCSCGYKQKTGIGCRHMIWICRELKRSYMQTVHQRWKFDKKPEIIITRKTNRSTRRRK